MATAEGVQVRVSGKFGRSAPGQIVEGIGCSAKEIGLYYFFYYFLIWLCCSQIILVCCLVCRFLSCGLQDLHSIMWDLLLWPVGSLVVAHMFWNMWASVAVARKFSCSGGMWDPFSPTRDQTCVSCIARQILNHWTTREVLLDFNFVFTGEPLKGLEWKKMMIKWLLWTGVKV